MAIQTTVENVVVCTTDDEEGSGTEKNLRPLDTSSLNEYHTGLRHRGKHTAGWKTNRTRLNMGKARNEGRRPKKPSTRKERRNNGKYRRGGRKGERTSAGRSSGRTITITEHDFSDFDPKGETGKFYNDNHGVVVCNELQREIWATKKPLFVASASPVKRKEGRGRQTPV